MHDPLTPLRDQLAMSEREREYLDFDPRALDDEGRRQARDLLVSAALAGDPRAPALLPTVESGHPLDETLAGLLGQAPTRVKVEVAFTQRSLLGQRVYQALEQPIREGWLDRHGLRRAIDLALGLGLEPQVMSLLSVTLREDVRGHLIEALWQRKGLHLYPTVWWRGLGLLRRTLGIGARSFREPAIPTFLRLLASTPLVEGYAPEVGELPTELRRHMSEVKRGQGPLDAGAFAALSDEHRRALLVYAAEQVIEASIPRAVQYVALLGGSPHRDVLEHAAAHPLPALAEAGREALALLDQPLA